MSDHFNSGVRSFLFVIKNLCFGAEIPILYAVHLEFQCDWDKVWFKKLIRGSVMMSSIRTAS